MKVVCVLGIAIFLVSGSAIAESIRAEAEAATTRFKICIGCFVEAEKLRAYLRWDSDTDLDLHIFRPSGPNGLERGHVFYGDEDGPDNTEFGVLKCDDQGSTSSCTATGEKFSIHGNVPIFAAEDPERPYCFVVRRYRPRQPTSDEQWQIIIEFDGKPAFRCEGSTFEAVDERRAEYADIPEFSACGEVLGGRDGALPSSGVIKLAPLESGFVPNAASISSGPGAACGPIFTER